MYITSVETPRKSFQREQKMLGAFYTPSAMCELLADWAITEKNQNVLEPSFGGCCFLEAALSRLSSLGNSNPYENIYGSDIDSQAFLFLKAKIGESSSRDNFIHADFLGLNPSSFGCTKFQVIIGNPPYISHHNTSAQQKITSQQSMRSAGHKITRLSSLWAHFVLHSLDFIADGGRMAFILPWSFLHAEYAKLLREVVFEKFHRTTAIVLHKRLFLTEGTKESSVILLGEKFRETPILNGIELKEATTLADLSAILRNTGVQPKSKHFFLKSAALDLLPQDKQNAYKELQESNQCKQVGAYADIKIGTVTGANNFFVMSLSFAQQHDLVGCTKPILSKFNQTHGLALTKEDFQESTVKNQRCLILDTSDIQHKRSPLRRYLASFPRENRKKNATFRKRSHWYDANDERIPHAFFPYMHHIGPRFVLNTLRINCTNTIHRVFFNEKVDDIERKLLAISFLTTFTQLSAEIEGRCYGSGVLKLEPSGVRRMNILMPKISEADICQAFQKIDTLLKQGEIDLATQEADSLIIKPLYPESYLFTLNQALIETRKRRAVVR